MIINEKTEEFQCGWCYKKSCGDYLITDISTDDKFCSQECLREFFKCEYDFCNSRHEVEND